MVISGKIVLNLEKVERESSMLLLLLKKKKRDLPEGSPGGLLMIKKDYYLVSALTGSLKNSAQSWLVDSGASRHMTGNKDFLENFKELKVTSQVELGDDANYEIRGIGSVSFHLDSVDSLHFEDVLFVPGLTKNLISVGVIEEKGHRVVFIEKKALLWFKDSDLNSAITIGVKEGGLYKVPGLIQALVHSTVNPCELWHRRLGHLHFKALLGL